MCDRSRTEILAREMCFMYLKGTRDSTPAHYTKESIYTYIDDNYRNYMLTAVDIISTLALHKE